MDDRIEYNKKPGKPTTIKVIKDPSVARDDIYKSGTIHTGPGEPPNSQSKPTPRGKRVAAKPITKGKLLRPGGPGGPGGRPQPQVPQYSQTGPATPSTYHEPQQVTLAAENLHVNGTSHSRNHSAASSIAKAPRPPPPSAQKKDTYKALYAFTGQSNNELTIGKDEVIEVLQKESNGKPTLLSTLVRLPTHGIFKVVKSI